MHCLCFSDRCYQTCDWLCLELVLAINDDSSLVNANQPPPSNTYQPIKLLYISNALPFFTKAESSSFLTPYNTPRLLSHWQHRPKMSTTPDALDLFLDDPSFANLLWAIPALFKAMILVEFDDATEQTPNIRTLCIIRVLLTALMIVAAVLGVLVLNRTLFLMMMVAASTFGFGFFVVGIWVLVLGYVATAREFVHREVC